jgi:sulfur-oxidizing protein SoxY
VNRSLLRIGACLAVLWCVAAPAASGEGSHRATAEQPSESWDVLKEQLFGDRPILDGTGMITLDAPYRAEDAAIVPIGLSVDPGRDRRVTGLTLVIDQNPVPVAGEFELGAAMGRPVELSMRLRVDAYSNIRAIAELDDGTLHQFARFVKASGGCSAPALKDQDAAMASLGEVRLHRFPTGNVAAAGDARAEAQVMVRHPNNSGFQMDPISRHYIPALFVDRLSVLQGDELLFRMSGGISISEDPTIRFRYVPKGSEPIHVIAADTEGREFRKSFATDGPS